MWQKVPVYETYPTLTKSGKNRYVKQIVKQPRDIECWFSFALNSDIDGLKRMVSKHININLHNIDNQNIGVLACENNLPKVFQFFIESGGQLDDMEIESYLGSSFQEIVCSPLVGLHIFKVLFSEQYIKKAIFSSSIEELIYSLYKTELFNSDKNIQKIKYLVKLLPQEKQSHIKNMIFYHISHRSISIPKILYYVSNKEFLKTRLNTQLKISKCNLTQKLKI